MSDYPPFDPDAPQFPETPAGGDPGAPSPFDAEPFGAAEPFDATAVYDGAAYESSVYEGAATFDGPVAMDPIAFDPSMFDAEPFVDASPGLSEAEMFFDGGPAPVAYTAPAAPAIVASPAGGDGAAAGADAAGAGKRKAAGRAKDGVILGLHVTRERVYGVLVRPTAEGYEPLRQFVRNRLEGGEAIDAQALTPDTVAEDFGVELDGAGESVRFGGAAEIDFAAEFAGLSGPDPSTSDGGMAMAAASGAHVQPVLFEVKDILEECEQAGYARPSLAFTVSQPDVDYAELTIPIDRKGRPAKGAKKGRQAEAPEPSTEPSEGGIGGDKHEKLVALLQKNGTPVDKERVGFLPMTPRGGLRRYLAVSAAPSEPVVPSVKMLREQARYRRLPFRTLQAEVPLLVGLASLTASGSGVENTAVVRVGSEDTLVLLLADGVLHHMELMQSVTAFDGPDTICSRVLLQQDVQGIGTVHQVIVMAEERESDLVQGFAAFYPEARVETLREGLARLGLVGPYGPLAPPLVQAAGAAIAGSRRKGLFEDVNLLPAQLRKGRSRFDLSFSWHTIVAAVLLFLSVLFFVYLFVSQRNEIAAAEQRLAEYPPEAQMSAPQLQARIDSLRQRQAMLTHNMGVLDSLLFGTDRWTQTMLMTTRAAASTGGIWIEEWQPSGHDITIGGFATARGQVVQLAERLEATIQEVSFQEIRERPVYQYKMSFTVPPQLPQTTRVVREQMGEPLPAPPAEPLTGMPAAGPPPMASGPPAPGAAPAAGPPPAATPPPADPAAAAPPPVPAQ